MNHVCTFEKRAGDGTVHTTCFSHMCSFQTCPTAKPSTAAVHIQLNLLEGSKGGEMTSRST